VSERTRQVRRADPHEGGRSPVGDRQDRWEWRRKIRADPRKYPVYRLLVGLTGGFLVVLGLATGWLPGPGGIPLVLAGLAVLASEFEWARRLLFWAKHRLQDGRAWLQRQPRWVSWLGGVATVLGVSCAIWLSLAVFGYPAWAPDSLAAFVGRLPGVEPGG
jgi:uncharacterized protein (TIGR02611 family)